MKYDWIIGIDPGKQGGMVAISKTEYFYSPMPETDLDIWLWFDDVRLFKGSKYAIMEKVWAIPKGGKKQGSTSIFTFGEGYGKLQMALCAAGLDYETVTPKSWQKHLEIKPRDSTKVKIKGKLREKENQTDWKNRLRDMAEDLHPDIELWSKPKTVGKQKAISDAVLLAEYGIRRFGLK